MFFFRESEQFTLFPDITLPDRLFNGIPFKELPICNIRVSRNNTIVSYSDHKGKVSLINSSGIEGFKNCRKGTNIAAQATSISVSAVSDWFIYFFSINIVYIYFYLILESIKKRMGYSASCCSRFRSW